MPDFSVHPFLSLSKPFFFFCRNDESILPPGADLNAIADQDDSFEKEGKHIIDTIIYHFKP